MTYGPIEVALLRQPGHDPRGLGRFCVRCDHDGSAISFKLQLCGGLNLCVSRLVAHRVSARTRSWLAYAGRCGGVGFASSQFSGMGEGVAGQKANYGHTNSDVLESTTAICARLSAQELTFVLCAGKFPFTLIWHGHILGSEVRAANLAQMLIHSFASGPWQTNCYVVAQSPGSECVIVDPGLGATDGVRDFIGQKRLKPVAVMVTHGHADHMWSVLPLADGYGIPAVIHGDDRVLLSDPGRAMSKETAAMLDSMLGPGERFAEPSQVLTVEDGATIPAGPLTFSVKHAPGHTQGCVVFDLPMANAVFTGDVLFAGSIGRTDLPGGSMAAMQQSLRDVILPLPDEREVHPGHGRSTTMSTERATNPYLIAVAAGQELA